MNYINITKMEKQNMEKLIFELIENLQRQTDNLKKHVEILTKMIKDAAEIGEEL